MKNLRQNIKEEDIAWYTTQLVGLVEEHHSALIDHKKVLTNHAEGLDMAIKMVRKNRRLVKLNTILSVTAISYVVLSTRMIMHQDKRIDNLNGEIVSLMRKHDGEKRNTEGN